METREPWCCRAFDATIGLQGWACSMTKGPGFAVLYRWRLHAGHEDAFIEAWTQVSVELRALGSLGSRLHRGPDGLWYSYAQWPSEAARARAFAQPDGDPRPRDIMRAAIAERLPEILLEPVSDLLVTETLG
jgi:Antibiotic biosynthesis monooxygenase